MRLARKLFSLSLHQWRDLVRAQAALWQAQWEMRRRPTGELLQQWRAATSAPTATSTDTAPVARGESPTPPPVTSASPSLPSPSPQLAQTAVGATQLVRAREIGEAVRRVALYGVTRPQCLARSMAITALLAREGIHGAVVRIGVRQQSRALLAHAWVEYGGEVVGDSRAHVRAFALLATAKGATPS